MAIHFSKCSSLTHVHFNCLCRIENVDLNEIHCVKLQNINKKTKNIFQHIYSKLTDLQTFDSIYGTFSSSFKFHISVYSFGLHMLTEYAGTLVHL